MITVYDFMRTCLLFLEALLWFNFIVYGYCYKEQHAEEEQDEEEEEEEDIELGNDDHCCSLCHEDVKAFSEILRLSKCQRKRMAFMISTKEFQNALMVLRIVLLVLFGILPDIQAARRKAILKEEKLRGREKPSDNLKNCVCVSGTDRCPVYHEDLKSLEKTLDNSKCKHIRAIFNSFEPNP
ncbi:unnamed protein product [Brassica rapa subsp. narinosa]